MAKKSKFHKPAPRPRAVVADLLQQADKNILDALKYMDFEGLCRNRHKAKKPYSFVKDKLFEKNAPIKKHGVPDLGGTTYLGAGNFCNSILSVLNILNVVNFICIAP